MVLAFLTVGALLGSSVTRGMVSLSLGLFLGLVGVDAISAQQRFTLGIPALTDGIDVVLVAVGLFAVGEALYVASRLRRGPVEVIPVTGGWRTWMTRDDWRRSWRPWLRGTGIGFPIGTIPGRRRHLLSYAAERRLRRGAEEGLRARSRVAAQGREQRSRRGCARPAPHAGPADDRHGGDHPRRLPALPDPARAAAVREPAGALWTLIASLYIGNLMLLVLNLPLVGMWVKILQIPRHYLYAGIITFAALGACGELPGRRRHPPPHRPPRVFMRRYGYPVAPMIGLILGPMFRRNCGGRCRSPRVTRSPWCIILRARRVCRARRDLPPVRPPPAPPAAAGGRRGRADRPHGDRGTGERMTIVL